MQTMVLQQVRQDALATLGCLATCAPRFRVDQPPVPHQQEPKTRPPCRPPGTERHCPPLSAGEAFPFGSVRVYMVL
ncbi:MAG: hypothetical protein OXC07_06990 [Kistimonas sp.]|nr:hypothetical protein [Kistimonas sp.]